MKNIPNNLFFAWVEEEIANGREARIRVKGESMYPFLRNGVDDVVVSPCRVEDLKLLDIVLFRYKGKHVMHRIVGMTEEGYTLQGDGVWASQEYCKREDVVGKVVVICPPMKTSFPVTYCSWIFLGRICFGLRLFRRWLLRLCRLFRVRS